MSRSGVELEEDEPSSRLKKLEVEWRWNETEERDWTKKKKIFCSANSRVR